MSHVEYPELSVEARSAVGAGLEAIGFDQAHIAFADRKQMAAFLRAVLKIAAGSPDRSWPTMVALADNLHSPPPPPPTLAQAREAARQLAGPSAEVVHAFLFSLLEEGKT
jgi:hypothetical protein